MVGPEQSFLCIGVDQLSKKRTIKGGVLTNKYRLSPFNLLSAEQLLDRSSYRLRGRGCSYLIPDKTIDAQTLLIALSPSLWTDSYDRVEACDLTPCQHVYHLE